MPDTGTFIIIATGTFIIMPDTGTYNSYIDTGTFIIILLLIIIIYLSTFK